MEMGSMKDAFDRVFKKQKLSSTKTHEVIDKVGREIESLAMKMQSTDTDTGSSEQEVLFRDLKNKLNEMTPINLLEGSQKDLNIILSKYTKLLEKHFNLDISKAYRHVDFDVLTINQIIATHFYCLGLFDLSELFVRESYSNEPSIASVAASMKLSFSELHKIVCALKSRNVEPALSWASSQSERLSQNGSSLEYKLHKLQFIEIVKKGSRKEALSYARKYLAPFASLHKVEIQKLMACLLWAGRLEQSPYHTDEFMPDRRKVTEEFTHQFCSLLGFSHESGLKTAIAAGIEGLPTLLKMASVMAATKKGEWQSMKQLPVPVDLGTDFQFHSIFVCPVTKEQGSEENPPMLMPCGHVLSKQSIVKLSKNSSRQFKCPYCPLDANVAQCRQLHF